MSLFHKYDTTPVDYTASEEEQLAQRLSQWGTGCIEEVIFYSHTLRVVDMRTHLVVYEFANKRGTKIAEYQKDDKLWRYKAVCEVFGNDKDATMSPQGSREREMFMLLIKSRIRKLIGTENEEEKALLAKLVMQRMMV